MSTAVMTTIRHLSTVETREEHWFAFSIKCINILKGVWSLLVQYCSTSETWSFWIQHCVWMFIHIGFHLDSLFSSIYIVHVNGYIVFINKSVSSNSYLQFSGKLRPGRNQSGHLLARLWWKDDILSCNTPPHTHTPPSCLQEGGIIQEYPGAIPKGYLSLSEYPVAHDWGCYHPKLDRAWPINLWHRCLEGYFRWKMRLTTRLGITDQHRWRVSYPCTWTSPTQSLNGISLIVLGEDFSRHIIVLMTEKDYPA